MKDTRQRVYEFIKSYIEEHHYPPTFREIGDGVGLRSTNTVHGHVHRLQELGMISMVEYKSRNIVITSQQFGNSEQVDMTTNKPEWKEKMMEKFIKSEPWG